MRKSKYSISEYWRNKISQNEKFWYGLFNKQSINHDSIIISPVILNSYSNQAEDGWAVYPNVQSVLGFLQYIYLPTAFTGIIKGENMDYPYYFQEDLGENLYEYKETYPEKVQLIEKMENLFYDLITLWDHDHDHSLEMLKQWTQDFNRDWEESKYISCSFHVFGAPKEAADFIVAVYEEDLDIKFFEDEIGLSKDEFLQLASDDLYQNDFLKRKFTDILTNRLSVAF